MKNVRPSPVVLAMVPLLLTLTTFLIGTTVSAAAQRPSRIGAIDDADRVTLPHTTHPLARPGFEVGPAEPNLRMERMLLVLGPSDAVQPQLRALIDGQHDKKSPNYHKWITPEQFGERFGPSQQDLAQVTGWLQQKGFDNIKPSRGRSSIEFSGSAQLVQQAFATEMHYYQLNGEKHLANAADISIPRAMSGIVRGVTLENFSFTKPSLGRYFPVTRNAEGKFVSPDPLASGGGTNFLVPGDFANIYNLNPLFKNGVTGKGSTIAVVARSNILLSDVETFRQAFNLPPNDPAIILNGQDPGQVIGDDLIEASLDSQWTGAVAPNATVDFVVSQSTPTADGVFLSEFYIVDNNLADIMSVSFNSCEQALGPANSFINALYQQAAAQGISVFVSSGDSGAANCDPSGFSGNPAQGGLAVNGLASTPFNTAVGGTEFNEGGNISTFWGANSPGFVSALGYIPEMVWNESCDPSMAGTPCFNGPFLFAATGGGVSAIYSKPSWQSITLTGVPNDNQRDVPDVSLTAAIHDGYLFCVGLIFPCTFTTQQLSVSAISGTSASVQAFAGLMALVDQQQGGRQGLANYVLYKLAANETFANCNSSNRTDPTQPAPAGCIFNDTTVGNNGVNGNDTLGKDAPPGDTPGQFGYNATPGYDSATGLGSVDATNLVNAWSSVTFLGSMTTLATSGMAPVQHGQPISFNINVSALSGSGTPSGAFVLIARNAPATFNGTAVGSGTLANGVFSGPINSLPGGEYQVEAHYGGDGVFGGSISNVVPVNVSPENSSVAMNGVDQDGNNFAAPALISLGYGVNMPMFITVSTASGAGTPTGTVALMDGTTQIAQAPLNNNGQAAFTNCDPFSAVFCLPMGTHTLTAVYSGDPSAATATSPELVVNVIRGIPRFAGLFECCEEPQVVSITANFITETSLVGIPPTGTITFTDTVNGTTTTLGSPITLTPELLFTENFHLATGGTHVLSIQYSGDNNYLPASSTSAPFQVGHLNPLRLLPQVTLTNQTSPIVEGQPVTLTVAVSSSQSSLVPKGQVFVMAGNDFVDPPLGVNEQLGPDGTFTFTSIMPNGSPILQAFYDGDANFNPTVSAPLNVSTVEVTPALSLSSSAANVPAGASVSLLATMSVPVGADLPQGVVQFFDSLNGGTAQPLGATQLLLPPSSGTNANGSSSAGLSTSLPAGVNTITIAYSAGNYSSIPQSSSPPLTVTVNPGPAAVFTFAAPTGGDTATVKSGQTANFNVFLNSNGFLGSVALTCTGAPAGMTCTANPTPVDLTATVTSVPVQVTVTSGASRAANSGRLPFLFALALGFAPLGLFWSKRQSRKALLALAALCLLAGMGACGGGSSKSTPPPPGPPPVQGTFTLTLTGTDSAATSSIALKLTVNP